MFLHVTVITLCSHSAWTQATATELYNVQLENIDIDLYNITSSAFYLIRDGSDWRHYNTTTGIEGVQCDLS